MKPAEKQLVVELLQRIAQLEQLVGILILERDEARAEAAMSKAKLAERDEEIARLKSNSTNSHKPSSADGYAKPDPKSLRTPSGKKSGGQPGHSGMTLKKSENPDRIVPHLPPLICDTCGSTLPQATMTETRQVHDIPKPKYEVTEHQVFASCCACGKVHCGAFPNDVKASVQYGPNAKAFAVHLTMDQMLPLARTGELFDSMFGMPLSDATILAMQREAAEKCAPHAEAIAKALLNAPVIHPDETGFRAEMKLHWIHTVATAVLTWLGAHAKRGREAMDAGGILPKYKGIAVHDCWGPYFGDEYGFTHALCDAHLGRELVFVHETTKQKWAKQLKSLLWSANRDVKRNGGVLPPELLTRYHAHYDRLLAEGEVLNPPPPPSKKPKRGRKKRGKTGSLVARMKEWKDAVWRFATVKEVPFTNNLAEQAVRMPKVKQKVSGCFRTKEGLDRFCAIRTVTATAKKQGLDALETLTALFCGQQVALRMG